LKIPSVKRGIRGGLVYQVNNANTRGGKQARASQF